MKRVRFNLGSVMVAIAVAAFGLWAFRFAPEWWPGVLECLALVLTLVGGWATWFLGFAVGSIGLAVAVALASKGLIRATAAGYAAFGSAYLMLSVSLDDRKSNDFLYANIITPQTIGWMARHLGISASRPNAPYLVAAHSLLNVAAGTFGALIAGMIFRRLDDHHRTTISPTGPS